MTGWQVQTMTMGRYTVYIVYEFDKDGYTGRYGYVDGYGQVPQHIYDDQGKD